MKQEVFESRYAPLWQTFEDWIVLLAAGRRELNERGDARQAIGEEFPALYRRICHHLAVARNRRYSLGLQQRLNQLALQGHQYLYRSRTPLYTTFLRFLARDFPRTFRRTWRYMLLSTLLFYLPAAGMAVAVWLQPDLVYSLLDPGDVSGIESMYDPANDVLGRERLADTDVMMFGYYIYNNVSIGFQTFAGGLLFGIGSLFYLVLNGLYFGAILAHLSLKGFTSTFWPFVAGHSSFELTAITIFGGVGLMIGFGALAPGRRKRWHAIRDRAIAGLPLIYGGALMLVAAAFVEAFWSSTTWPPIQIKYAVGGLLWACVGLYFGLMGGDEPR